MYKFDYAQLLADMEAMNRPCGEGANDPAPSTDPVSADDPTPSITVTAAANDPTPSTVAGARASSSSRALRDRRPATRAATQILNPSPSTSRSSSVREKRKATKKTPAKPAVQLSILDENGRYRSNGVDACDCLEANCPGCHFPCPKCGSGKCANVCRNGRRWVFESVEKEGLGITVKNTNDLPDD